ncbi:MAG: ATP-binding cassette domain-containing protein [Butyrivibrio sp.]
MLQLKEITKNYTAGDTTVMALKGVSIAFRESEFVSILGQSGCGKTTMLNIIGGLDRYTSGDLIIGGRSTKDFKDKDWDSYRNHKIGFVFQSYNLIPHQSVLSNVELALTLSGVGKTERRKRAIEALEKVGLKDQINKKPNQMSGGQMQRVAIARALVNNPDIILADEPTGALDSETSIQIMNILKEISKDKLIIMVTHNAEIAEKYSSRIIRLLDGKVIGDSSPYEPDSEAIENKEAKEILTASSKKSKKASRSKKEKVSMSLGTALSLSFKNLLTKKGRTFLTSFAGSIGIIGIALILSLSSGFQAYINKVQEDTISTYPITIENESIDMTGMMESMMGKTHSDTVHEDGRIYASPILGEMLNTMLSEVKTNSLKELKAYFESDECDIDDYVMDIQYAYDIDLNIYTTGENGILKVNPNSMFKDMMGIASGTTSSAMMDEYYNMDMWSQMIDNKDLLTSQYDVLAGHWPQSYNEVVLVADENNQITDVTLYSLGLKDASELSDLQSLMKDPASQIDAEEKSYTYDELMDLSFRLILPADYYKYDESANRWNNMSENDEYLSSLYDNGIELKICGIVRPSEDAVATSMSAGTIGYTKELVEHVLKETSEKEIVKAQLADDKTDVFTGLPFATEEDNIEITMDDVNAYIATLSPEEQKITMAYMSAMTEQQIIDMFKAQLETASSNTYEDNLLLLGYADESVPATINIYAKDFQSKDRISEIIDEYNEKVIAEGNDNLEITYTDYIGLMMSSVSTVIDTISYVLIAFVSISLVVSSIMIGIITYISVLERTKEIGILRSIGASKHDVSRVFNAETMIVGLVSGSLGILITLLINIPVNIIIKALTGISNVAALPLAGAIILIIISIVLTMIAGLIPAKVASRKDPVIALRSE